MTLHEFDPSARVVVGTVGPAGSRAFYLQAAEGPLVVTVAVEKQQVSILADRIIEVLDQVLPEEVPEPGEPGGDPEDSAPLRTPFEEDWRVQTLSLAWNEERNLLVLECHDHDPDELEDPGAAAHGLGLNSLRTLFTPAGARAFARRTQQVVSAGRPPCPFCGGPLDPSGHVCPRANGYKR